MMFVKARCVLTDRMVYVNVAKIDIVRQDGDEAEIVLPSGFKYRVSLDGFAHIEDFVAQLGEGLEEHEV